MGHRGMRSSRASAAGVQGLVWKDSIDGLPLALVRARECVMAHFRHLLRRYNLTEPQWRVLKTMDNLKTIELSELARKSALLMPSLSRIVRELEQRGYMTKTVDQTDMRRMLATLTERGRMLVNKASPECEAVNAAIRAAMGTERMAKLQGLLVQLEKRIGPLDFSEIERPTLEAGIAAPGKQRGRPRKIAAAETAS
jgi:homoprotocatechuate degradation regulator HpaR